MRFETIIFDFFGVICSEVAPFWLPRHFSAVRAAEIKASLIASADRGEISQTTLFETLSSMTGVAPSQIEAQWCELARPNDQVIALVRRLRREVSIGLLTNSPAPFVRRLLSANGLGKLFDAIVVSSECGCAKPDPALYEIALAELSADPATTLLIDDNPKNVAAASALGLSALLFTGYTELQDYLQNNYT